MTNKFQEIIDILRHKDKNIRFNKFATFCKKNNIEIKKTNTFSPSNDSIEIIIPCIDKDANILPLVIDSARKNILHNITSINIISPSNSIKIKQICEEKNCCFIDEAEIFSKEKVTSNWLYQQFLKLSYCNKCKTDNYLILDADTIINQPISFIENTKYLLEYSDEYHKPYFRTIKSLKLFNNTNVSFIAHHMFINKDKMMELLDLIEKTQNKSWNEVLLSYSNKYPKYNVSEYEIYANFMIQKYPEEIQIDYFNNVAIENKNVTTIPNILDNCKNYRTISFHDYSYATK